MGLTIVKGNRDRRWTPLVGRWYPLGQGVMANTQDTVDGRGIFVPFWSWGMTIDRLGVRVQTAGSAGATGRVAIYANRKDYAAPGALVIDGGELAADTTGDKVATVTATRIPDGLNWTAITQHGSPATKPVYQGLTDTSAIAGGELQAAYHFLRALRTANGAIPGAFPSSAPTGMLAAAEAIVLIARAA